MAFWEKNLALPITGSFTWCPGPAATHRLGSTLGAKASSQETEVVTERRVSSCSQAAILGSQ